MNMKKTGLAMILLLAGVGVGYWVGGDRQEQPASSRSAEKGERKPLYYRNPMNPTVTSPVPAKDSMGMDYVPVYADDAGGASATPGTVVIDPTVVQSIGVRTARADRRAISRAIQTTGRIGYDEELLTRLHPKVSGWIEKVFVDETGEKVKPDTILLSIYSPQLVASEEEFLLALKNTETLSKSPFADIRQGAIDLLRSSRQRLELLDVPAHQIRKIAKTRRIMKSLHIHSPASGIILKVGAREGSHVTPATELYAIADLSRVWIYVDVYEYELPWVRVGDTAEMRLTAVPGRVFKGKITYIYPYLDPKTRTNKVRLEFDNRDGLLKPDMFADVTIHAGRRDKALVIPEQAVIRTGRKPKVFVQTGPGRFTPRTVRLGVSNGEVVEVLDGVRDGEIVVTSAQFLIDSESSLKEAAAKMVAPKQADSPQSHQDTKKDMDMKGMNMSGMEMKGMDMKGMSMPKGAKHE